MTIVNVADYRRHQAWPKCPCETQGPSPDKSRARLRHPRTGMCPLHTFASNEHRVQGEEDHRTAQHVYEPTRLELRFLLHWLANRDNDVMLTDVERRSVEELTALEKTLSPDHDLTFQEHVALRDIIDRVRACYADDPLRWWEQKRHAPIRCDPQGQPPGAA